jgi:hypothetical protein
VVRAAGVIVGLTYFTTDLISNTTLADLPLQGARFNTRLKNIGDLNATLPLRGTQGKLFVQKQVQELIAGTVPGRTAIWADLDGTLVWGGILFDRLYDSSSGAWSIRAREFPSFYEDKFYHRDVGNLNQTLPFIQVDQFDIVRALIQHVASKDGGDIGMVLGGEMSGVLRDRTYRVTKYKHIFEAIDELSNVINGFDYAVDVYYDTQKVPQKRLTLSYPRRGKRGTAATAMFEFPGDILKYTYPEEGTDLVTRSHAQGEGTGRDMKRSFKTNTSMTSRGWPLYEQHKAYTDVKRQSTLDDHAQSDLDMMDQALTLPKITVPVQGEYPLGTFIVGDHVRAKIEDVRFPDGYDQSLRLLGIAVDGNAMTMELEFGRVDSLI